MTVANETDVRRALPPSRENKLWRAFHTAWDDVARDIGRYSIWPRSRANMMFERLAVRLQEAFSDDSKVRFCFADETVKITFNDVVVARCKKANGQGFGQNVPTQAVMAFCEAQDELPGFAGLQKIEIVYEVNMAGTALDGVVVQARDGNMRLWAYPLGGTAEGATVTPLPLPPAPPESDGADLVQPRTKPASEEETDKSEK